MTVQYIFHSGFLLETAARYYLFDYYQGELPQLDTQKPIVVFSSHNHRDHFNPEIFTILNSMDMKDIYAVLSKDISEKKYPKDIEVLTVRANIACELPCGEHLETLQSTDSGVAFLLTTEEGVIYHAGDLNDWFWDGEPDNDNKQMRGSYRHEINKLKGRKIDVAFIPLDPRQDAHYADGLLYFLAVADAKCVYPMHYWQKPETIDRFLSEYPQYRDAIRYPEKQ
ncbi:MAG TPA: MBL fold metallo-hydrolase [Oscillospiraceae bacterium]|nr:MBL fold metallo-hydrolase [Oscillospiraceae bacterium]HPK34275.1 MBL fold metallo-hydrolase [Oscillospiraceae bacterium]HPR74822.1 MBL fold metallo-hydrolase [Oscillospiraceae bacterium]